MPATTELDRAQTELQRRVAAVEASQWALPTPCERWTVRDLVVHVVEGSRMATRLLEGASAEEARAVFGSSHGELLEELDDAFAEEAAAFALPGALESVVHHPAAGDVPGATLYGFRTGDYVVHAWDLARATDGDEVLSADLVTWVWESLQPVASIIGQFGVFGSGPSGTVPDDVPLQRRLLDLTGRRP